jgi:hypothetical protein
LRTQVLKQPGNLLRIRFNHVRLTTRR